MIQNEQNKSNDEIYLLINFITKKLDKEVKQATTNLFYAAKHGPMYGCLTGINALLKIFNGHKYLQRNIFDLISTIRVDLDMKMNKKSMNGDNYSNI